MNGFIHLHVHSFSSHVATKGYNHPPLTRYFWIPQYHCSSNTWNYFFEGPDPLLSLTETLGSSFNATGISLEERLEQTRHAYAAAIGLTFTVENCSTRIQFLDVEMGWELLWKPTVNVKKPCFSDPRATQPTSPEKVA